jgi:hypothetical protein
MIRRLLGDSGIGLQAELRFGSPYPRGPDEFRAEAFLFFDQAWVWNQDQILNLGRQELSSLVAASAPLLATASGLRSWSRRHSTPSPAKPNAGNPRLLINFTTRLWPWRVEMTTPRSLPVRRLLLVGSALGALAHRRSGRQGACPGLRRHTDDGDAASSCTTAARPASRRSPSPPTMRSSCGRRRPSPLNPYVFLPAGNVATFQNADNLNFAVLNRIAFTNGPSRFDGSVISQLVDGLGTATRGGTILFQSPGGIIIGSSASSTSAIWC